MFNEKQKGRVHSSSRWIQFLGGRDLVYTLGVIILIGIMIFLYTHLDFVFLPIVLLVSNVLIPFLIAFILYYIFSPLIDFADEKGVNRTLAIAILYILTIGLLVYFILSAIPNLQAQFNSLMNNLPDFVSRISKNILDWFESTPLNVGVEQFLEKVDGWITNLRDNFGDYLARGVSGVSSVLSGVTSVVMTALIVPVILFFLLKDGSLFFEGFVEKMPPKWREDIAHIGTSIDVQVGSYIKGQILIAIVNGVMMYLGFMLIGLNYAALLAIAGGFLSIIPYLGPTLTFIPALFVALTQSWLMVGKLIIVWLIVQFIEGNLVEPNIMGKQLNIHPLSIIIILLVAGDLLGLFGLIFGVPLYAILKIFVTFGFQKFKKRYNKFYGKEDSGEYEVFEMKDIYDNEDNHQEDEETAASDDKSAEEEIHDKAVEIQENAEESEQEKIQK